MHNIERAISDKVESTTVYSIFTPIPGNRGKEDNGVNKKHLDALVKSIQEDDLLAMRPILINDKYQIIDGNHRFEAAKILGKKIYYTFYKPGNYEDTMRLSKGISLWRLSDYAGCRAINGEKEYVKLKNFLDNNRISLANFVKIANIPITRVTPYKLKEGKFEFLEDFYNLTIPIHKIRFIIELFKTLPIQRYAFFERGAIWKGFYNFVMEEEVIWTHASEILPFYVQNINYKTTDWRSVTKSLFDIYNNSNPPKKIPKERYLILNPDYIA